MLIEQPLSDVQVFERDSDISSLGSSDSIIPHTLFVPKPPTLRLPPNSTLPERLVDIDQPSLPPPPPPLPDWKTIKNTKKVVPQPPPLPNNWKFPAPRIVLPSREPEQAVQNTAQQAQPSQLTCPVCWEEVTGAQICRLDGCLHSFCQDCVSDHFKVAIFNGKAKNMTCLSPGCKVVPQDYTIQRVIPEEIFIKYQVFKGKATAAVTSNPECRWCPRPGCENAILRKDKTQKKLICDAEGCGTQFCFDCRLQWHEGLTCDENRKKNGEDWEDSWKEQNNAQNCPKCGVMSQRIDGCDWIKCPICTHEFCWACLEPHDHNMSAHVHGPRYRVVGDEPYHNNHNYNYNADFVNNANARARRRRRQKMAKHFGMVIAAPVVAPVAVGVGVAAACVAIVGAPFYFGYKFCKKRNS